MTAPRWEDVPEESRELATVHLVRARERFQRSAAQWAKRGHSRNVSLTMHAVNAIDAALARLAEPAQSSAADGIARARLDGVRAALDAFAAAHEVGGVTATRLARNLGYTVGDLYSAGLQEVANMIGEASEALQVIAAPYHVETPEHAAHVRHARDVLGIATTPREPTAAERWRAVPERARAAKLSELSDDVTIYSASPDCDTDGIPYADHAEASRALLALAREAERSGA